MKKWNLANGSSIVFTPGGVADKLMALSDLGDRRFWAISFSLPHLVKRDGKWRIDNIEGWDGHNRTDFERAWSWVRRQNFETSK